MISERPRSRAAKILAMPRDQRDAAAGAIKDDALRSAVQLHIEVHNDKVETLAKLVLLGKTLDARRDRIAHVPIQYREEVKTIVQERYKRRTGT